MLKWSTVHNSGCLGTKIIYRVQVRNEISGNELGVIYTEVPAPKELIDMTRAMEAVLET